MTKPKKDYTVPPPAVKVKKSNLLTAYKRWKKQQKEAKNVK